MPNNIVMQKKYFRISLPLSFILNLNIGMPPLYVIRQCSCVVILQRSLLRLEWKAGRTKKSDVMRYTDHYYNVAFLHNRKWGQNTDLSHAVSLDFLM